MTVPTAFVAAFAAPAVGAVTGADFTWLRRFGRCRSRRLVEKLVYKYTLYSGPQRDTETVSKIKYNIGIYKYYIYGWFPKCLFPKWCTHRNSMGARF